MIKCSAICDSGELARGHAEGGMHAAVVLARSVLGLIEENEKIFVR